jgi:hypothetical protein
MNKMKRPLIIYFVLIAFFVSCTDNFEDFNTDKKNPAVVSGNALFSNAQKALVDQVSSTNVNFNIFKLVAQYWTETTYTDEANYDLVGRNIPEQIYREYYRETLKDLDEAATLIADETDPIGVTTIQNRLAIIKIIRAYAYSRLADIFGNIIYSDAINIGNVYPDYDDAATVYADLITKIDNAISELDVNTDSYGASDLIYGGDVAAWIKFANTLKIKIGITIADANASLAQSTIEGALSGAFASSDDDALLPYQSAAPNYNPLYADLVASGRKDFVAANTIVDIMNDLNDPRRAFYFTEYQGAYVGGDYGWPNSYLSFSHIHPSIEQPTFPGILLTHNEMMFYLAEAAERGFSVGNTAEYYYNEGITESILGGSLQAFGWGTTQADADAYLAQTDVAYATAPDASADGWRQKIGTQSWLASYTRGLVGYTTWRRLDYPVFNVAELIESTADIPTRFTYPVNEQTLNSEKWKAASDAIGGDEQTTKIFWDINPAN